MTEVETKQEPVEKKKAKRGEADLPELNLDANGVAHIDLGVCSASKASDLAQTLMFKNQAFQITFVKRQDEHVHVLEHMVDQPEFMTDANGKKWKRVYS